MGRLSKEQVSYIKENVEKMTNKEMANELGCCISTISNWRKKMGISFSEITDFTKYYEYIIKNYQKRTAKSLSEEIGCSKSLITKIWMDNGLNGKTNRSYYCNFSYFSNINTPNKAYILGLITADGCIYERNNHEGMWNISIHKDDEELLDKIRREIQSNNPIKQNEKMSTLTVVSQKMFDDLVKIGIIPRKTFLIDLNLVLKNIPQNFHPDFIRGYFDGDGSITVRDIPSKSRIHFSIPEISKDIFISLLSQNNIKGTWGLDIYHKYTQPFGTIEITDIPNKYCFLKTIYYNNHNLSLHRKMQLGQELCFQIENNITNRSENKTAVIKWEELLET